MSGFLSQLNPEVRRQILDLLTQLGVERDRIDGILGGSSTVDHGTLLGLGDNDHPQYALLTALQDEATLRSNADITLQNNIDAEELARIAADAATLASANSYTDTELGVHVSALDPHPQYETSAEAQAKADAAQAAAEAAAAAALLAHHAPSSTDHDDRYYTEAEADTRFVNVTGDTMTGALSGVTPTAVAHLTRKDYVDAADAALQVNIDAEAATRAAADITLQDNIDQHLADATAAHAASAVSYDGLLLSPVSKIWHPDTIVDVQDSITTIIAEIDGRITAGDTAAIIDAINNWTGGGPTITESGVFTSGLIVADAIASGAIVTSKLAANSVTAAKIVGGTITGDKISSSTSITVGTGATAIELQGTATPGTTSIKSGTTGYGTGTGFYLDASGRFSLGTELTYNGAGTLAIGGYATDAELSAQGVLVTAAQADATQALADALAAQGTADGAQTDATTALADAATAQTTANTAITNASTAQSAANAAQSTANSAVSAAAAAQSTADAAWTAGDEIAVVNAINLLPGTTTIDGGKITTNSLTADQIAANAITASEIASNAVTATKILAGEVTAGKLAAGAVVAGNIAANAVTAGTIAAGTIVAGDIAANTITAGQIAAGTITADEIASATITGDKLVANTVTATHIAANTITTDRLATDAIQSTLYTYTSGDFSDQGSSFALDTGTLRTPGLFVDGGSGDVAVKGAITATEISAVDPLNDQTRWAIIDDIVVTPHGSESGYTQRLYTNEGSLTDYHSFGWSGADNRSKFSLMFDAVKVPVGVTSESHSPGDTMEEQAFISYAGSYSDQDIPGIAVGDEWVSYIDMNSGTLPTIYGMSAGTMGVNTAFYPDTTTGTDGTAETQAFMSVGFGGTVSLVKTIGDPLGGLPWTQYSALLKADTFTFMADNGGQNTNVNVTGNVTASQKVTADTMWVQSSTDVTSSGGGGFQIGSYGSGYSVHMDVNELQAFNNGSASDYNMQLEGGMVNFGNGRRTVIGNGLQTYWGDGNRYVNVGRDISGYSDWYGLEGKNGVLLMSNPSSGHIYLRNKSTSNLVYLGVGTSNKFQVWNAGAKALGWLEATGQIQSLHTGTTTSWDKANILANPSSGNAVFTFHPGSIALQLRVGYGVGTMYVRNSVDSGTYTVYAYHAVPSSGEWKHDVQTWGKGGAKAKRLGPLKPDTNLTGAPNTTDEILSPLDAVKRMRPVAYRLDKTEHLDRVPPDERRQQALSRLNEMRRNNGQGPFVSEETLHMCGRDCDATPEDPCVYVKDWEKGKVGFISEELAEILPEAVRCDPISGKWNGIDTLAVVSAAIGAIQEQQAVIEDLQRRIEVLENRP